MGLSLGLCLGLGMGLGLGLGLGMGLGMGLSLGLGMGLGMGLSLIKIYHKGDIMNVEQLVNLLKRLEGIGDKQETFHEVGKSYLFRTVTMIYTGKIVAMGKDEIKLTKCAWVPETKRWADTVDAIIFEEIEPYLRDGKPLDVIINRGALLDSVQIPEEKLPMKQK